MREFSAPLLFGVLIWLGFLPSSFAEIPLAQRVTLGCTEELTWHVRKMTKSYPPPRNFFATPHWQTTLFEKSAVLTLVVRHNFLVFSHSPVNGEREIKASLFGRYDQEFGWVWYYEPLEREHPKTREEFETRFSKLRELPPFGIIPFSPERKLDFSIRYMCRELIRNHIFSQWS